MTRQQPFSVRDGAEAPDGPADLTKRPSKALSVGTTSAFRGSTACSLRTLHSTTPPCRGYRYAGQDGLIEYEAPWFYDWLHDEAPIRAAMLEVTDTMRELPFDDQEWKTTWARCDPKTTLIPILGHRYVVADDTEWILSIFGDDAIIYGHNLRDYLLDELAAVLARNR